LRADAQLPFASASVDAPDASVLAPALRKALATQGKLAANAKDAPVRIRLVDEKREKNILSLSGGGKVREYRIIYKVTLKVTDDMGSELIAPIELQQMREYSYDDALILAKEAEEASLNRAMQQETLRQALRRLSYLKR
jgi:LPS-assembly lipoprotein